MYTGNLIAELFYFLLLCGSIVAFVFLMLTMLLKAIATIIGNEIVSLTDWLKKWANN